MSRVYWTLAKQSIEYTRVIIVTEFRVGINYRPRGCIQQTVKKNGRVTRSRVLEYEHVLNRRMVTCRRVVAYEHVLNRRIH